MHVQAVTRITKLDARSLAEITYLAVDHVMFLTNEKLWKLPSKYSKLEHQIRNDYISRAAHETVLTLHPKAASKQRRISEKAKLQMVT